MAAGIYLHIPFCRSRCSYCDFATDIYRDAGGVATYVEALVREIGLFRSGSVDQSNITAIDTIYFGGGTPSLVTPDQVEAILKAVHQKFSLLTGAEITMEMNPATVTPETLREFRSLGVNRTSFGVQTFNDRSLKRLARAHDANDARQTFAMLRDSGFDNISFDLIAGLPRQTLADWERNLTEAITMQPEHLSLYLLEIHEGTPLAEQIRSGRQPRPDEEIAAEMYEMMIDKLADAGYSQYEISNFSKLGFESRHNTKYWMLDPVFGFGVSAHSFDGTQRYANERDTANYVSMIEKHGFAEVMREDTEIVSETIFLGLRLEKGIDLSGFATHFGFDLIRKYEEEIERLTSAGLVDITENNLRLTRKGKLFSNEVFSSFV
jgi:oxygen-independent coproporphyrinogen-3 oxidase